MEIAEMTARIEEEETRIRELLKEMDTLVPSIVAAVSAEVVEWSRVAAKDAAEGYFTNRPKQHAELGAKLPKLKAAIDAMLARLPSLVEGELERLGSWAHKSATAMSDPPWTVRDETQQTWWKVARTTYGFIAQPLGEHHFLGQEPQDKNLWDADSNHPGFYNFAYGGMLKAMPESVRAAVRPYRQRWAEIVRRRQAVADLEKDRAKAAFTTTWGK
jgi:sulfur carrier protein ThiS